MNRISIRLLAALAIFLFVAVIPIAVSATNEDVSIVDMTNSDLEKGYIIYIKGTSNQKFKYAFTTNANPGELDLSFINSILDNQGNNVAVLNANTYEKLSKENKPIFMWAKDESEKLILQKFQLDLSKSLTKENIENVESLTKKIPVKIAEQVENTTTIKNEKVEGIEQITKVGYIQILDDDIGTYYYEMVKLPNDEKYNQLNALVNQVQDGYNAMDIYEKLQFVAQFNETYETVINQAEWKEVNKDGIITQPETSIEGDKYIVLLKEVGKQGEIVTDIQILTAYDDEQQKLEKEQIVTQETTKLPITYDSIVLFVVLGIIVILIIVVFIRMKVINKKDEQEK